MKIVRFSQVGAAPVYGELSGSQIKIIEGDIFGDYRVTGTAVDAASVKLLAPVDPPNIICIGLNYKRHADESGMKHPTLPVLFLKTTNTIVGPEDPIVIPKIAPSEVDYEVELAIVVGKTMKNVPEDRVFDYVLGYTCANDVSARDIQLKVDVQWTRGKSMDTFMPIGPAIATEIDPDNADIEFRLNGQTLQKSNTSDMIFNCSQILSFLSQNMTLFPGTIISTGTPEGVGFARKPPVFLKPGDVCEVDIAGIGVLRNPVVAES